jgi:predicted Zn finger-like uncharacterized protein
MFTECPECSTAFRVTAKVLQQAGGRVRCGGCGHAFSALEHLTEEMPASNAGEGVAAKAAPTDTAPTEEAAADDLTSEQKFKETSKQLLQTLSELTGADEVRIEDTGIEWAVVDDEDAQEDEEGAEEEAESSEDAASLDALVVDDEQSGEFLELAEDYDEADAAAALKLAGDEPTDLAANEGDDWDEVIDDDEDTAAGDDIPLEVEEELAAIHSELSTKDDKEEAAPDDLDSQFEMQAEAMGIDISGSHEVGGEDEGIAAEAAPTDPEPTDITADAEVITMEGEEIRASAPPPAEQFEEEDKEQIAAAFTPDAEVIELSLAGAEPEHAPEYSESHGLPEQSEEELTINQEIDQELLAIASKDEDLGATIVGLESLKPEREESEEPEESDEEEQGPEVETIIMEGDQIRGAFEREREREKREAALKRFDKAGNLIDSYVARRIVRGGRRSSDPLSYGMIAGVALLVMVLFGQVVHANRQSLSTSALFNQTIGNVYRLLGNPITPEWSIKGWQFEATNGSVAEDEDVLTIFSRIGNHSEQPLPYPLVHVSLTDRWEEIIGSAVLEPGDYLAADLNPNQPVVPGENFTAVITIDEPSVDATGFKLNVCYRVSPGRVRCATEDFKD